VILDGMGTVHQLRRRREVGEVTFHAAIMLGIGDDDLIAVVSEAEHITLPAARDWAEHQLPRARSPSGWPAAITMWRARSCTARSSAGTRQAAARRTGSPTPTQPCGILTSSTARRGGGNGTDSRDVGAGRRCCPSRGERENTRHHLVYS
jgi:hypothetical protein